MKLEKTLRKKLNDFKDLPLANIFLKKFKEKTQGFSPVNYLDDKEKYFELMKHWKNDFEKNI